MRIFRFKGFLFGFLALHFCVYGSLSKAEESLEKKLSSSSELPKHSSLERRLLGSVVGFGVGHAMEDRYSAAKGKGWLFTIGEVAPFAIVIGGSLMEWTFDSCSGDAGSHSDCDSSRTRIFGTSDAWKTATAVFLAFKVWEIFDLWSVPLTSSRSGQDERKAKVGVLPLDNETLALGFKLSF